MLSNACWRKKKKREEKQTRRDEEKRENKSVAEAKVKRAFFASFRIWSALSLLVWLSHVDSCVFNHRMCFTSLWTSAAHLSAENQSVPDPEEGWVESRAKDTQDQSALEGLAPGIGTQLVHLAARWPPASQRNCAKTVSSSARMSCTPSDTIMVPGRALYTA